MNWNLGSSRASSGGLCFHSLHSRQLSHDPILTQSSFQQQWYGLPSFVKRLQLEQRLEAHEGCVNCINFSPSGQLLASGSDDLHVVLWDWAKGRMLTKLESGHISNIFQVRLSVRHLIQGWIGLGLGDHITCLWSTHNSLCIKFFLLWMICVITSQGVVYTSNGLRSLHTCGLSFTLL